MKQFLHRNGLSLVLLGLFAGTVIGQLFTGFVEYNQTQQEHGQPAVSLVRYMGQGHFLEALAENWESEFLQMWLFVVLTALLYQKGSPEANDPDKPADGDVPARPAADAPWPVRRGGWVLWVYSHSLSIAFLLLFLGSFYLHALGGMWDYNEDQAQHGQPTTTLLGYVGSARFWFESMQNWQSEFLSLLAMVVLSIFLREKGSAESKEVGTPNRENE